MIMMTELVTPGLEILLWDGISFFALYFNGQNWDINMFYYGGRETI